MNLTIIAFVLAVLGGWTMAFARHPIYGLLTYVGVFYLNPQSRWWGEGPLHEVRWSLLAGVVTLLALAVHKKRLAPVPDFFRQKFVIGLMLFIVWLAVQLLWALDTDEQLDLLSFYCKFLVVIYLIYRCVDSDEHLRWFLWSHVLGCFYLSWLAFTSYTGGRFEGFGGPGIGEANAGALQIVTGILAGASLFLAGRVWGRAILVGIMPILVNALVTTISRSGFISFGVGGIFFNLFTPKQFSRFVKILSVLGVVLFFMLTNPFYWARMDSIKYKGEHVEGVDTGGGRLELIMVQFTMFKAHPMGCGHMCTTVLSPSYLPEEALDRGQRASHNTFMSVLVDHGIPGAALYVLMVVWIYGSLSKLARHYRGLEGVQSSFYPAIAGSLSAIIVADQFVQYPRLEVRYWFIALVLVLLRMSADKRESPS